MEKIQLEETIEESSFEVGTEYVTLEDVRFGNRRARNFYDRLWHGSGE